MEHETIEKAERGRGKWKETGETETAVFIPGGENGGKTVVLYKGAGDRL